jgi:hypothetical protein
MTARPHPRSSRFPARLVALPVAASVLLGACTVMPTAPTVTALPGSRKSVEQYQVDVGACQQYAGAVVAASGGGTAAVADNNAAATATAGALLGAATGAIIGAATGQAGQGAAIGAGAGLLFGGLSGSNYTAASSSQLQWTYNQAYLQCMYSRGNSVPAGYVPVQRSVAAPYSAPNPGPPRYPPPNMPPPPLANGGMAPNADTSAAPYIRPAPASVPPSNYPPPNMPPPSAAMGGTAPNAPASPGSYSAPPYLPPSSYPPPDAPPPANLPARN